MEAEESYTISGNGLETTEPVNSHVDNLILSFTIDGQEYITRLDNAAVKSEEYNIQLNEKLDRVIELLETVSANSLPEEPETEEAAQDPIPVDVTVTLSENTVSENTVENALITTPLSEFSVTDSLLVIIILLLIVTNFFTFLFRKGYGGDS